MYGRFNNNLDMKIEISDDRTLASIQADFNARFPFLKLEFFKAPHKIGEASAKSLIYDNSRFVRDCRVRHLNGFINIDDRITVNELEDKFLEEYGLSAQVFRKSGNVWLETSATDSWTLRQQNDEGAELSTQIREDNEDSNDSDIY